jgi:hypothetical protein
MGFFERWREKRRLRRVADAINAALAAAGAAPEGWEERSGGCVCNLRVARMGLVTELKSYLKGAVDTESLRAWSHLQALRDGGCYIVPHDLARPVAVSPTSGEDTVAVASAVRLLGELDAVDDRLRIKESFALKKMVDYLDATESDIAAYESRFGTTEGFWAKFAFVLVRKLAEASLKHKLPAILS